MKSQYYFRYTLVVVEHSFYPSDYPRFIARLESPEGWVLSRSGEIVDDLRFVGSTKLEALKNLIEYLLENEAP